MPGLVAEMARAELADVIRLTTEINALETRLSQRTDEVAPTLLDIDGCAQLTAAKIVGEAAGIERFKAPTRSPATPEWPPSRPGRAQRRPDAVKPLRQPPTQRCPAPHRRHPDPHATQRGQRLLPTTDRRRKNQDRSPSLPQTPHRPPRLPSPSHRPPNPKQGLRTGGRLT